MYLCLVKHSHRHLCRELSSSWPQLNSKANSSDYKTTFFFNPTQHSKTLINGVFKETAVYAARLSVFDLAETYTSLISFSVVALARMTSNSRENILE